MWSRRSVLKAAFGVAIAGAGGVVAVVRSRGYAVSAERAARLRALSARELVIVEHLARRLAAADREGVVTPDDVDVAGFVDAYAARMNDRMRRDLSRFLTYVEQLAPIAAGYSSRFTRLAARDQDVVLASIESSSKELLRGGFAGVKSLIFLGYYRDPRTWSVIGYEGPTLARPPT